MGVVIEDKIQVYTGSSISYIYYIETKYMTTDYSHIHGREHLL